MLIGDWECNETAQIALWKDGVFQDYEEVKESKLIKPLIEVIFNISYFYYKDKLKLTC